MDRDTDREGLRFPLRYNLIGIDCNSWGLSHIHTLSLPLTHTLTHSFTGTCIVGSPQKIQTQRLQETWQFKILIWNRGKMTSLAYAKIHLRAFIQTIQLYILTAILAIDMWIRKPEQRVSNLSRLSEEQDPVALFEPETQQWLHHHQLSWAFPKAEVFLFS